MDTMRLSKEQADSYVIELLKRQIDCTDALCIITSIDQHHITYELKDYALYHNKSVVRLTPLAYLEYILLLKRALSEKGYHNTFIKPIIRQNKVKYEVSFRLLEKEMIRGRRK